MAIAFSRSTISLSADTGRSGVVLLVSAMVLFGAWLGWFVFGRITMFEHAEGARLEVHEAVHSVETAAAGRVTAVHMALGVRVGKGDVLVELSAEQLRLEQSEREARSAGIEAELSGLRQQIDAQREAIAEQLRAGPARIAEARADHERAQSTASFAATEAERARLLEARHALAGADRLRAENEARTRLTTASGLAAALLRVAAEQRSQQSDQRVELARLQREAAMLEGQLGEQRAALQSFAQRIAERSIRAPVAGVLGEVGSIQPGSVLREGDRVASVVPPGSLRVSAEYSPDRAVGRIEPGQPARVRFYGFPWTQFGSIPARVTSVGDVASAGKVRVELSVSPGAGQHIRLQHGLQGSVSVEVERTTPAVLALRLTGQLLRTPAR
jgi:multidrug resistance efflux pump